jgi:hypothetical protein
VGRRGITVWLDPAKHTRLRHLAVDLNVSLQQLLEQALDGVLERHDGARLSALEQRRR